MSNQDLKDQFTPENGFEKITLIAIIAAAIGVICLFAIHNKWIGAVFLVIGVALYLYNAFFNRKNW